MHIAVALLGVGAVRVPAQRQSALYVGYGDERALAPDGSLARAGRQLFAKISYAWQR